MTVTTDSAANIAAVRMSISSCFMWRERFEAAAVMQVQ
jgi:hypothetical protein